MKYRSYYWRCRLLNALGFEASQLARAKIHPSCMVDSTTHIDAQNGSVTIGEKSTLHPYAMLIANGGNIIAGAGLSVNPYSVLYSGKAGLMIGENVRIAAHAVIIPENHNIDRLDSPIRFQGRSSKGVTIGSDVWIGAGVKILDGAEIGDGCVIGANAVVIGEIPPFSVAVGIPAKVIKSRLG
jgi:acetyltransferase-like isoleucine patch superfamily enzyme